MTILWVNRLARWRAAIQRHLGIDPTNSLGGELPQTPAAEGTGTHPASAGRDVSPCVSAPPQDVSRPTEADRRHMAEQIEASGYGEEVQW